MHAFGFGSAVLATLCTVIGVWTSGRRAEAATLHVRVSGDDGASGLAWGDALRSVNRALNLATAGDEVWVAAGVYTNAVRMKPDVGLYGGFGGDEPHRDARNPRIHETTLDGGGTNVVVWVESGGAGTIVEGFTIQHGGGCGLRLVDTAAVIAGNRIRWNTSSSALAYGAGISVKNFGSGAVATIRENVLLENYAFDGGGVACIDASPRIVRNTIAWNTAMQNGGGISCWRDASPVIENNAIYGNTASWVSGGGQCRSVAAGSSPRLMIWMVGRTRRRAVRRSFGTTWWRRMGGRAEGGLLSSTPTEVPRS